MTNKEYMEWSELLWKQEYELHRLRKKVDKEIDKAYATGFVFGIITFVLGFIGGRYFL